MDSANDTPALNADGSLKEAHELEWAHSPSADTVPLPDDPPTPEPSKVTSTSKSGRVRNITRLQAGLDFEREPTDQPESPPSSPPAKRKTTGRARARVESDSENENTNKPAKKKLKKAQPSVAGSSGRKPKKSNGGKKPAKKDGKDAPSIAQLFLKASDTNVDNQPGDDHGREALSKIVTESGPLHESKGQEQAREGGGDVEMVVGEDGDDQWEDIENEKREVASTRNKRGGMKERRADVLTFCKEVEVEGDDRDFLECEICVDLKKKNPRKYAKLQTVFAGNLSTMRSHVARNGSTHFAIYDARCKKLGIALHTRAIPDDVDREKLHSSETLDGYFAPVEQTESETAWSKEGLLQKIINFITECDQAISIIDHPALRELLQYQRGAKAKEADVPHRTKLTESIKERAKEIEKELGKELRDAPGRVSLTFDGWTTRIMDAYIGVTVHYINNDWELRSEVLSFEELDGSHSGENQAAHLYSIIKRFGIENKLMNFTSDNVNVNDKTMRILSGTLLAEDNIAFDGIDRRSNCFAHAVALATKAFLTALSPKKNTLKAGDDDNDNEPIDENDDTEEEMQALLEELEGIAANLPADCDEAKLLSSLLVKIRGFIAKVRKSPPAKKYFRKCCKAIKALREAGVKVCELVPFCKTRWETWEAVINRFILLEDAITGFINTADDSKEVPDVASGQAEYRSYKFCKEEWTLMGLIHDVLKEASLVQQKFSSERTPTVGRILPVYDSLMENWKELANDKRYAAIKTAINAGIAHLEKYFAKAVKSTAQIIGLFLNPFTKTEYFDSYWTLEGQNHAYEIIDKVYDEYHIRYTAAANSQPTPPVSPMQTTSPVGITDRVALAAARRRQREEALLKDLRDELKRYKEDPLADPKKYTDELDWWKCYGSKFYPVLALIARDYLAVQGSSVPCERMFSSCGLINTNRRTSMEADTFSSIEIVKAKAKNERTRREMEEAAKAEARKAAAAKKALAAATEQAANP